MGEECGDIEVNILLSVVEVANEHNIDSSWDRYPFQMFAEDIVIDIFVAGGGCMYLVRIEVAEEEIEEKKEGENYQSSFLHCWKMVKVVIEEEKENVLNIWNYSR